MKKHEFHLRVYYEDTDIAGIVYYANYLKFIERGRSEFLRHSGVDQAALLARQRTAFAVRYLKAEFLRPAGFDDWLRVETELLRCTGARLILAQRVLRGQELVFSAEVTLACITESGRPTRIPGPVTALI